MAGDIFISYSRRDTEFVTRLVDDLEDRQAFAWIDRGNIGGGQRWREAIEAGIRNCMVFVLIVSPDSIASNNVMQELETAFAMNKPILPLYYRRAQLPAALDARLREYERLDFTRGGYASNLLDVFDALAQLNVHLDIDRAKLERRRDERLGAPVDTEWTAVFGRVPRWGFAWAVGWAIFLLLLGIAMIVVLHPQDSGPVFLLPLGGFVGGLVGGLVAGFFTMVALRHNATSIRWRHMSPTIWIWSVVGPIGVIAAFAIAYVTLPKPADRACTDLGDCLGQGIAEGIGQALGLIFSGLFYSLAALFTIGAVAGWLAVRHIRRLEPGILGRQAFGVLASWGFGSIVAAIVSLIAWALIGTVVIGSGTT